MTTRKESRLGMRASSQDIATWRKTAEREGLNLSSWLEMLANQRAAQVEAMRQSTEQV